VICSMSLNRVTLRAINHSGMSGLKVAGLCGRCGLRPRREDDPRGRPRPLGVGRANESEPATRGKLGWLSSGRADSSSRGSESSGGGVSPEAEAIFNVVSAS
jgi:hypothetical protein